MEMADANTIPCAYPKRLSLLPDRDISFGDIVSNTDGTLLDIFLHRDTPKRELCL